jgi:hypothetical protein
MTKVKPGDQCCDDRPDPLRDEIKASLEGYYRPRESRLPALPRGCNERHRRGPRRKSSHQTHKRYGC